jgi:hypothetical protein
MTGQNMTARLLESYPPFLERLSPSSSSSRDYTTSPGDDSDDDTEDGDEEEERMHVVYER